VVTKSLVMEYKQPEEVCTCGSKAAGVYYVPGSAAVCCLDTRWSGRLCLAAQMLRGDTRTANVLAKNSLRLSQGGCGGCEGVMSKALRRRQERRRVLPHPSVALPR
jgi:hypothetical protein